MPQEHLNPAARGGTRITASFRNNGSYDSLLQKDSMLQLTLFGRYSCYLSVVFCLISVSKGCSSSPDDHHQDSYISLISHICLEMDPYFTSR